MENRKFTPADIIEGQIVMPEPPVPARTPEHHALLDRILHSQIVFEARKHVKKRLETHGK